MRRNVGWRYESTRHALAAKGIPTGRRYNYVPTYVAGDLPLIAGDAVGVAGAEAVSLIPAIVPVAMLYGGAKLVKHQMEKGKKKRKTAKRKYDASKKVDDVQSYIRWETGSNGKGHDFWTEVREQIRHPLQDMDKDWESMERAAGKRHQKANGVELAEERAAATLGKVVSQANIEPLVDKHENQRRTREELMDILFGRRAYNARISKPGYAPGTVTMKTVNKLRLVPVRRAYGGVPSKEERQGVEVGDRVAVLAEGMGRSQTFPAPDKIWLQVTSKKRKRMVGRIEHGTGKGYTPFIANKKIGFTVNNIVDLQKSTVRPMGFHRIRASRGRYMYDMTALASMADDVISPRGEQQ